MKITLRLYGKWECGRKSRWQPSEKWYKFSHSILSPIPTQQPQKAGWTTNSYFMPQDGQKIKLKAEQQISVALTDRRGTNWVTWDELLKAYRWSSRKPRGSVKRHTCSPQDLAGLLRKKNIQTEAMDEFCRLRLANNFTCKCSPSC